MKQLVTVITMATLAVGVAVASETLREKTSTGLGIAVDGSGRITERSGAGVNRLHPDEPGFLITIREYEKDGECWKVSGQTLVPKRMVPIVGARGKDLRVSVHLHHPHHDEAFWPMRTTTDTGTIMTTGTIITTTSTSIITNTPTPMTTRIAG